jgi:hypothetical protein
MKVRVHPGDQRAVGHVRMIWPARAAEHAGIEVDITQGVQIFRDSRTKRLIGPQRSDVDVIVLQRPSHPDLVALIPQYQNAGIAVVVDVDDDIAALPPSNRAYGSENQRLILRACALADLVTVTAPPLARRYAPHGRAIVLPNCVPAAVLDMPQGGDGRTVGWGGWTGTHPGDLAATHGGVAEAIERAGARFHVIGPDDLVQEQLGLKEPPSSTGPLTDVPAMHFELALGDLDVGIVPLANTTFNESKSTLKGLQYAARGVPFVASPLPEYMRLAAQGAGILAANRSRNWRAHLVELLGDTQLRQELSERGRRLVEHQYTYERMGWRWAEAWETALEHRRSAGLKAAA